MTKATGTINRGVNDVNGMVRKSGESDSARKNRFQATTFTRKLTVVDHRKSGQSMWGMPRYTSRSPMNGTAKANVAHVSIAGENCFPIHLPYVPCNPKSRPVKIASK